ncbi:hypothetical protein RCI24_22055 [Enterobacter hormaechei]|uniref:hypothetical protein n=1 Tax=Enterobacter hormaechei TaxID=158836 RepID=UPI002A7495B2|nr:hypothetical protein [Enterobacter hormaechei]MDY3568119.1 hypothetical protein [Enterobacter hormaechei]
MSTDKIADLKAKFVAGAIPLESDYATLLNMLEETRVATGTSPDAPKSPTMRVTNEGYLDVAVAPDGGVVTGASGLSTDARVLWARNHAIATGASQYGIWNGGYAFIYTLDEKGAKKLVVCQDTDTVYINSTNAFKLANTAGVVVVEERLNGVTETVPGWTERFKGVSNTWPFNSTTTTYSTVQFIVHPKDGSVSKPTIVLHTV